MMIKNPWEKATNQQETRIASGPVATMFPQVSSILGKIYWKPTVSVTDRGKEECVDPEGNGVTMSEGTEGGPGPPSKE